MTWKAILYVRKARIDQDKTDTAFHEQEAELKNYCAIHKIHIVGIYTDVSPGSNFDRPAFNELVNFLEQNKGIANLLLFTTWDRFTRKFDLAIAMSDRLSELGVEAKAIQENTLWMEFLVNVNYN